MSTRTDDEDYEAVMTGLDSLIRKNLNRGAFQQYSPDGDVDKSDHLIADAIGRVKKLRELRGAFEEIVSGAIVS